MNYQQGNMPLVYKQHTFFPMYSKYIQNWICFWGQTWWLTKERHTSLHYYYHQKGWNQKEEPLSIKIFDCWVMGFVLKTNCKKKPFIVFHFWEFQKQQQEGIAVSPQYWAKAAASKVVEQQASPKISNFPFWFSQNQKTNSILRKGFEIENSLAVMSPLNGHNKGPYKRSFWFQHLWSGPYPNSNPIYEPSS